MDTLPADLLPELLAALGDTAVSYASGVMLTGARVVLWSVAEESGWDFKWTAPPTYVNSPAHVRTGAVGRLRREDVTLTPEDSRRIFGSAESAREDEELGSRSMAATATCTT